jgi:glutathione S-transferase
LAGRDLTKTLSLASIAIWEIEAAAAIIIGRRMTNAGFDTSPVGLRRRRLIIASLQRLEAKADALHEASPTIATIATVLLVDYLRFRFATAEWMPPVPALDKLCRDLRKRASFANAMPADMPALVATT